MGLSLQRSTPQCHFIGLSEVYISVDLKVYKEASVTIQEEAYVVDHERDMVVDTGTNSNSVIEKNPPGNSRVILSSKEVELEANTIVEPALDIGSGLSIDLIFILVGLATDLVIFRALQKLNGKGWLVFKALSLRLSLAGLGSEFFLKEIRSWKTIFWMVLEL